jgi:hypothetical protein
MQEMGRERARRPVPEVRGLAPRPRERAAAAGAAGPVQVIWGPFTEALEVGGMTAAEVFRLLRDPYNIAPGAAIHVNGALADPNQRLRAGDTLEFVRGAGEKGAAA